MKKNILIALMLLLALPVFVLNSNADVPIVVTVTMGTEHILGKDDQGRWIYSCDPPYTPVCDACGIATSPGHSYTDIQKFYFNPENQEIGIGYTHIDVMVYIDPTSSIRTDKVMFIYPTNQMITSYSDWLSATGLSRP
ncbi:MAG: hypothetical protein NTW25_04315 [Candidatus Kapabacteria bacterium]|nr:hypothetical protein [Candidatus Kapabacteria bacterium]